MTPSTYFQEAVQKFSTNPILGTINKDGTNYEWITYAEMYDRCTTCGSALLASGISSGSRIGIFSLNRAEWCIVEYACLLYTICPIALYSTLGATAVQYILMHAEMKVVFTSGENLHKLLEIQKGNCKLIICFDSFTEEQESAAREMGIELITLNDFYQRGNTETPPNAGNPDDLATIMYTSGTTGVPKGVMITNKQAVRITTAGSHWFQEPIDIQVHFSYLPLAHSVERAFSSTMIRGGGRIGFFSGNISSLVNDIKMLKPTYFVAVPRVLQRIKDKVLDAVNQGSFPKRKLFQWAVADKIAKEDRGLETPWWDNLIFKHTKEQFGGRIRAIISGAAYLDPALGKFIRAIMCCPVYQGYGLTEVNSCCCCTYKGKNWDMGSIGVPFEVASLALRDVPELDYYISSNPPCGEILVQGDTVFPGYFKDEEMTKEVMNDGWFCTGDIAKRNSDGSLSIIDRRKNIFKMSQGEYIAVEYLETQYSDCEEVSSIFIHGSSTENFLSAVVVPEWKPLLNSVSLSDTSDKTALCQNPQVHARMKKILNQKAKEVNLRGFEYIKVLLLSAETWSVDNDLMTPTFKLRRRDLLEKYRSQINEQTRIYTEALMTKK